MLQTEAMVMGTELSRLRATAHSNTQVGITSWPGAIKVSHPREFPGRTGFYRHLLCQKLPTVDRKKREPGKDPEGFFQSAALQGNERYG